MYFGPFQTSKGVFQTYNRYKLLTISESLMRDMILNTSLTNDLQHVLWRLYFLKKKHDMYKHMLPCTCQRWDKLRFITLQFAYCKINLFFFAKWNHAETAKMRSKAVEDKENNENFTSFRKFLQIYFYAIIPTMGGLASREFQ